MDFNWIPLKSIGPFKLGDDIEKYIKPYNLKYVKYNKNTNWSSYNHLKTDTDIYVENRKIISVTCNESCIFNGVELIGLRIEEVINLLECKPKDFIDTIDMPDGSIQEVYEFDDINGQIWVDKAEGIVVTVICGPAYEEEDE